jgi:hypothetical protein
MRNELAWVLVFLLCYIKGSHLYGSAYYTAHHVVPEPHMTNLSRWHCH